MSADDTPAWVKAVHHPVHMKGWEAIGCTGEASPLVRQLGYLDTFKKPPRWVPGTEKWAAGETRNGVGTIEIFMSADDPLGAYVYVCGTTEKGVTDAWHRAAAMFVAHVAEVWPGVRAGSTGVEP